jgi:hypothetical protein
VKADLSENPNALKGDRILSVILVNHNGKEFIFNCLNSIKENMRGIKSEVIVVDNHSTDGSADILQERYPDICLLRNQKNLGFSKANNQGIKKCKGNYILIINPDTRVYSGSIKKLLSELKENPDIGGIGPALINRKNDFQVSFGGKVNFFSEAIKKVFLNRFTKYQLKRNQYKRDVTWLSAACFMSTREVLKKAGMFDEKFFLYFEDIDLCMRIRKKGWRLVYQPKVKVFHEGGSSTKKRKLKSRYYYRESQIYFYQKHSSPFSLFLLKVFLSINFVFVLFLGFFKKNKDFKDRVRFFKLLSLK